jgi:hypothetical protein
MKMKDRIKRLEEAMVAVSSPVRVQVVFFGDHKNVPEKPWSHGNVIFEPVFFSELRTEGNTA